MTSKRRFTLVLLVLVSLSASPAVAQVATGTPPFNSYGGGPDTVNLGNNNVHWVFPIRNKPGRGTNFTYNLNYDSSVWYPVTSGSTTTWQPVNQLGWSGLTATGSVTYQTTGPHTCRFFQETQWVTESYYLYTGWIYVDSSRTSRDRPTPEMAKGHLGSSGTAHRMIGQIQDGGAPDCGPSETATLTTNDGSGYKLSVPDETLYTPEGLVGVIGTTTTTDRNGNQITQSGGVYTDTLGTTALTVTGSGTAASPYVFTYTAPSGASAHYTLNYTNYTVATNFGNSSVHEYKSSAAVPLPTSLVLPDSSQYTFTYEPTPSAPSQGACTPWAGTTCTTARLASITLPTGGTISYLYYNSNNNFSACTTGNNGAFSDGSASCLLRTLNDGTSSNTWTYVRNLISGSEWTTTITDPTTPTSNQTLIYFQKDSNGTNPTPNFYETSRQVYQGSTSGTLLRQWTTCYNGNTTSCATTAVFSPITQRNVNDQYSSSGLQCQHNYWYNSVGGLSEQDDYDYGSGSYGALLRKTVITYASLPPNITSFKQTVTICNGSGTSSACTGASGSSTGTVVSQTTNNYDEPNTLTATSGIAQHSSVSGSRGNLTSVNYPAGALTSHFTYYDTGSPNTSQDVNGATTTYNYSSASCQMAFPTSLSEPLGWSRTIAWNCTGGVPISVTDENNNTASITYSDPYFWRPAGESFPDGGQTNWTYNNQTSLTTTTKMNSSQNTVSTVLLDGLGRTSQIQLTSDPEGADYSVITYDGLGRPYRTYNPTRCNPPTTNCGTDYTWGYTTTTYDALGRVTGVTLQDGSAASTVYTNNTITATDAAGKTRQSTLDALGHLTQMLEDPGSSPHQNFETDYGYDALGNLLCVGQKGTSTGTFSGCGSIPTGWHARTYGYDAMSRLLRETNPETGTITYRYDSDSNCASPYSSSGDLVSRTDARSIRTCFQYDTLHRLTQKNYSDGVTPTAYFAYDMTSAWGTTLTNPIGRLTELWTGTPSTATTGTIFGYDPMGRITTNNQLTSLLTFPISYTYDLTGDTTSTSSGFTISQTYDAAGRPSSVSSSVVDSTHPGTLATVDSTVGYYPHGAIQKMLFGNGLYQVAKIEPRLQPCQINYNSSGSLLSGCGVTPPTGTVQDFHYVLGSWGTTNNDEVTEWVASGQQNFDRTFSYDSLNRLSSMQETSGSSEGCKPASSSSNPYNLTWTYDAWGNRSGQSPSAGTCSFSATPNNNNQLSGYQYDAAGNMTNDGSHQYFYDAENRLVQVDGTLGTCSTATACYLYGANGLRIEKITGSNQIHYFRDLVGNTLVERDQNANWLADYIYQRGQLLAEYKNNTTYFVHPDHLGSSRLLTGYPTASVVQNLDYLPFGEILTSDSGTTTRKFTGDERDSETNLDHTQFRQYSSQLGRWMHPDPAGLAAVNIANPQSWNRYAYVLNNPLNLIDPTGLYCVFLNDAGDAVESIDDNSSSGECGASGGYWIAGEYGGGSQVSINSDLGLVSGYGYLDGSWQYSVAGAMDSNSWGAWTQTAAAPSGVGDSSWGIWDTVKAIFGATPWSVTVTPTPGVITGAWIPASNTWCLGGGLGAGVSAPDVPVGFGGGPLIFGDVKNAKAVLEGPSVFYGFQPTPGIGWQHTFNTSGQLLGPTTGTWGGQAGFTVSGCKDFK